MHRGLKISSILVSISLIAVGATLMYVNPAAAGPLVKGFMTPIIALEFMPSPAALRIFFDVAAPEILKTAFMQGNQLDFVFMGLYSLLVALCGAMMYIHTKIKALWLSFLLALMMLGGDALENIQIAALISAEDFSVTQPVLQLLHFFTWLKWGSIGATFLLFSAYFFQQGRWQIAQGLVSLTTFGLTVAAYLLGGIFHELMALSVFAGFLCLMIFSFLWKPIS